MEEHAITESVTSVDLAQDTGDTGSDQAAEPDAVTLTDQISPEEYAKSRPAANDPFSGR